MSMKSAPRLTHGYSASALGALLLLVAGCEQQQAAAPPPAPPEVGLATASREAVPIILELSGTIAPVKQVSIIPRVSGFIFERYFTEGTFVDEGDPLYLIDPRPFEDKLARLKAQLKGEQASLDFWKSEQARYEKLAKQGAASEEQAEGARAKLYGSMAAIEELQVEIRNAELDLSFTKINAPFRGRMQQTQINVGNLVQAQRDVLTEIVQLDPIYVVFNLSRAQAYEVQQMQSDGRAFPVKDMVVEVILPDGQPYGEKGSVNFVSGLIEPTTDTVTVRGVFANAPTKDHGYDLTPGQYTPVRVTVGSLPNALVIPQTALVETQAGTHVYVVGDDSKVQRRVVETGMTHGSMVVVDDGLEEGERVVSLGVQKVRDGVEVKPVASSESSGSAGEQVSSS